MTVIQVGKNPIAKQYFMDFCLVTVKVLNSYEYEPLTRVPNILLLSKITGGMDMYFENIRPEDIFRQRMNGRGILIDLRNREEYADGHIPGAVNIPYEELKQRIPELRAWVMQCSSRTGRAVIIVYCDRGNTSLKAAGDLYKEGFRVKNVYGGMAAYRGPRVRG